MTDPAKPALSVEQEAAAKELHAAISRLPKYFSEQEVQNAIAPYVLFQRRQTLEEVIRTLRRTNNNRSMSDLADDLEAESKKETP